MRFHQRHHLARRRAAAGIVASVILFAMLFTVGTSYFLFMDNANQQYVQTLVSRANAMQGQVSEGMEVTTLLLNNGDVGYYINNTSGISLNMTAVVVMDSHGSILACDGVGLPAGAGCGNSTPPLWAVVNAGKGSAKIDTGYYYVTGTQTLKILTQRGNVFSATYPAAVPSYAAQATSSGSLTVDLSTFRWTELTGSSGLVQSNFRANCNSQNCGLQYQSQVTSGDLLVFGVGWQNQNAPTSVTDTFGGAFTLGVSNSVVVAPPSPTVVQSRYTSDCGASSCGLQYSNSVAAGNVLVFGLGWYNNGPPSTPTDSFGDSFSLGASTSVQSTNSPSVVQKLFSASACGSSSCALQYSSQVAAGDTLVVAVSWSCGNNSNCAPGSVSDTFGDSFSADSQNGNVHVSSNYYFSYIWYGTATSTGTDRITVSSFPHNIYAGTMAIYQVTGASTSGVQTSSGSSSSSQSTSQVNSFTPSANSLVIGNSVTSSSTTFSAQSSYTLAGTCSSVAGCSEYQQGMSSSTTVPFGLSPSEPYYETAISFQPATYYSYIWYSTAGSSGTDAITASFGSWVLGSVSLYELVGMTASPQGSGTGSSAAGSTTLSVSSVNPPSNSIVIGNAESVPGTFTAGQGYTLVAACSSVAGCSEYQTGVGSTTQVKLSIGASATWAESAVAFQPAPTNTYYSYIWYGYALNSGTDSITAAFSQAVAGTISEYELQGYTVTGLLTSTGSSAAGSTTAAVTSMSPSSNSIVIGNVETASSNTAFTRGGGYSFPQGGCGGHPYGCGEYETGVAFGTTVPFSLSPSVSWVESALAFASGATPQSGILVGGYPPEGVPVQTSISFSITFTNNDPKGRTVTLWPQSVLGINSISSAGGENHATTTPFYIIDRVNGYGTGLIAYNTTQDFIMLAPNVPTVLYFGSTAPLGSSANSLNDNNQAPFFATFSLTGQYNDKTLYGQSIPYPAGIVTGANANTSPVIGATGSSISVGCNNGCGFDNNAKGFIGWIDSNGKLTVLTTFTTTNNGQLPNGLTFTVPNYPAGYYTLMVSDYVNSVFMTFQHT